MPISKNASLRYRLLDDCFRHKGAEYTFKQLKEKVNDILAEKGLPVVSERTLKDDIAHMRDSNGFSAPIKTDKTRKPPVYYYEDPDFSISNNPLNPKEASLLVEALNMLARFDGSPRFAWLQELGPVLRTTFNLEKEERTLLSYEWSKDYAGFDHISAIFNAILNKRVLKMTYQPYNKQRSHFKFHPYFLKQYNQRWFLFGFNQDADFDRMNLALDRIDFFEECDDDYRKNETDWDEYFDDIIGVTFPFEAKVAEVKLVFSARLKPYVLTKPLHLSQRKEVLEDGRLEIRLQVIPNYELENLILSYGEGLEVIAPISLRNSIKERVSKMLSSY
jgi:predicted DNA-binding transcriptional regulator YafY